MTRLWLSVLRYFGLARVRAGVSMYSQLALLTEFDGMKVVVPTVERDGSFGRIELWTNWRWV